jgi:hypothetical protein
MKRYSILLLLLIFSSLNLLSQVYIELDGTKIPIEEMNPYSARGYEVDLTMPENIAALKNAGINKNMKITSQRVFVSKRMKSFLQVSIIEPADSSWLYLPTSCLKFFEENKKLKWEKKLEKKAPVFCYLTPDGKYSIVDIHNLSSDPTDETNSLSIFDEKGNTICDFQFPVKYQISDSRDIICYWEDHQMWDHCQCDEITYEKWNDSESREDTFTIYKPKEYTLYCFDLKTRKQWSKTFEKEIEAQPVSSNGDYISVWNKPNHSIYYRDGKEIINKLGPEFGRGIYDITNDGQYALTYLSSISDTTYFKVIGLKNTDCFKTNYYLIPEEPINHSHIYNGGQFVNNSYYLVVFNTIIAPGTAALIFHNIQGDYIGHKVYHGLYNPTSVTLLDDGSFEVIMDRYYTENLILPNTNTLQYLNK